MKRAQTMQVTNQSYIEFTDRLFLLFQFQQCDQTYSTLTLQLIRNLLSFCQFDNSDIYSSEKQLYRYLKTMFTYWMQQVRELQSFLKYSIHIQFVIMGTWLCCEEKQMLPFSRSISYKAEKESSQHQEVDQMFSLFIQTKNKKLSIDDFQIIGVIGKGGYGKVYLVEENANIKKNVKMQYAMKIIPKKLIYEKSFIQQLLNQKQILASINNHFLLNLIYGFQDKKNCYLVTEFALGGDAYRFINHSLKNVSKVNAFRAHGEEGVKFIVACVVLGLQFMHENNLIYRDLKPQNVLIFQNGYIKLADFGLSKRVERGDKTNSLAGTKFYLAPQIVQRCGYNHLVDLWTIGVFMIELLNLEQPFVPEDIVKGKFMKKCLQLQEGNIWRNSEVSQEARNLVLQLMKANPQERIGAKDMDEIKKHKFFSNIDWKKLQSKQLQSPLKKIVEKYPMMPINNFRISNPQEMQEDFPQIEGLSYNRSTKSTSFQ